jgi:hypothetical protein
MDKENLVHGHTQGHTQWNTIQPLKEGCSACHLQPHGQTRRHYIK